MNTLSLLTYIAGGMGLVCLLAELTSRANDYVNRYRDLDAMPSSVAVPAVTLPELTPEEHTASFWWAKVLSSSGMFGLMLAPLLVPILAINSYIIALNLEVMFGRVSETLFMVRFLGWEREITLLDLLAVLCSLGQIISASVSFKTRKAAESDRWLRNLGLMSLASLLVLLSFEVGSAFFRGFEISGSENGMLSAGLALGVGIITAAVGIFVIDKFFIPLFLAVCYSVTAPVRLLSNAGAKVNSFKIGNRAVLFFAHIFAAIDRSVMAPLRRLDTWLYALLFERKSGSALDSRGGTKNLSVGILLVAFAFGLTACEFSAKTPSRTWICALDVTTSIAKDDFTVMRDKWMAETCLSRLARGDEIHILPVNSDPEKNVAVMTIGGGRKFGGHQDLLPVYEFIRANLQQPKRYKGSTNIGGVLAYAKRIGNQLAQAPGNSHKRGGSIVVVIFSDGKLEGRQTLENGEWPQGMPVWFFGVIPQEEATLEKWATEEVGVPSANLKLVRASDWHTMGKIFGETIGRPRQNQQFLEAIRPETDLLAVAGNNTGTNNRGK